MKKALMIVLALSVFSGCSEATSSPHTPSAAPAAAQPQKKPENPTPPVKTPASQMDADNAFIIVHMSELEQTTSYAESRSLVRDPSVNKMGGYRAESSIPTGNIVPDKIVLSVPIPPEVSFASDDTIEVFYGCKVSDGSSYTVRAVINDLSFYGINGNPRAEIEFNGVGQMFATCAQSKVSVLVLFRDEQQTSTLAWEQVYLEEGQGSPAK